MLVLNKGAYKCMSDRVAKLDLAGSRSCTEETNRWKAPLREEIYGGVQEVVRETKYVCVECSEGRVQFRVELFGVGS